MDPKCSMCYEPLETSDEQERGICDGCYWDALETEALGEALASDETTTEED